MSFASGSFAIVAVAIMLLGCGDERRQDTTSASHSAEEPAPTPAPMLPELEVELEHLLSGGWEPGDVARTKEILDRWQAAEPDSPELAEASATYQEMLTQQRPRDLHRIKQAIARLDPGYAQLILDSESRAEAANDRSLQGELAKLKAAAIKRALEFGPQLAEAMRPEDARRVLTEAATLAPKSTELKQALSSLSNAK